MTPVRLEPGAPRSRVKYSATEPLRSLMANIEFRLGSFAIFSGSGPILLGDPIFFVNFQGGPDPLSHPLLDPPIGYMLQ